MSLIRSHNLPSGRTCFKCPHTTLQELSNGDISSNLCRTNEATRCVQHSFAIPRQEAHVLSAQSVRSTYPRDPSPQYQLSVPRNHVPTVPAFYHVPTDITYLLTNTKLGQCILLQGRAQGQMTFNSQPKDLQTPTCAGGITCCCLEGIIIGIWAGLGPRDRFGILL